MNGAERTTGTPHLLDLAREVYRLAVQAWGHDRAIPMVGRDPAFAAALDRTARAAAADAPVLIGGETGTGKELFARALFLLARTHRRAFVALNCGQYVNDQIMASELFGHVKGSFTGAVNDHSGVFQDANGGTVFLDEVGELSHAAQTMLLRVLSDGEVVPLGATRPRRVNVRVIAATNRDLAAMVQQGKFREDLYFRLHRLKVHVPALRERGRDWELIADYLLDNLARNGTAPKRLARDAVAHLRGYAWPGNVREVRGCVETGFYMSRGSEIELCDLADALEETARLQQWSKIPFAAAADCCDRMQAGEGDFWTVVYEPFMARDLNRAQVRDIIAEGLARSGGSYKRLLPAFGIAEADYLRFMDFLRHHRLKPERVPLRGVSRPDPVAVR